MASWKLIGVLFAIASTATLCVGLPAEQQGPSEARAMHSRNAIQTENDLMDSIYSDCLRKDSVSCVKYKLFSFVDKMLGQKDTFSLTEGVTVVKTANAEGEGAPRAVSGDDTIESLILSRVQRFLETHTLKVDLKGSDVVNAVSSTGRALEDVMDSLSEDDNTAVGDESRGKKKKAQKILGPLLAAVALKAAALIPLVLGGIALIAGKALLIAKIALVLSAIIGLKKLLGQQKHVTYEVVSHPHHSSSHVSHEAYGGIGGGGGGGGSGYGGGDIGGGYGGGGGGGSGHGGWGRSLDAQDLAYHAQAPIQPQAAPQ